MTTGIEQLEVVELDEKKVDEALRYLFRLQQSGRTNMYGAAYYLRQVFNFNEQQSENILKYWMDHWDELYDEFDIQWAKI